jgi:hypothetical protein
MTQRNQGIRILRIITWLILIPGTVLLIVGIGFGISTRVFITHSISANGKVIRLDEKTNSDGKVGYSPVFTYINADGNSYTIYSDTSSNPPGFVEGESVRVLYSKDDPASARIDSFLQLWLMPVVFCSIGGVFALSGTLFLFFTRKQAKNASSDLAMPAMNPQ